MHQFLTILFVFNIILISSLDATPAFRNARDKFYRDLCEIVDESDMKMKNGQCIFGRNIADSIICDKNMCYQGPDDACNAIMKCHPELQCVDKKCTGCLTPNTGGYLKCSTVRYNNY